MVAALAIVEANSKEMPAQRAITEFRRDSKLLEAAIGGEKHNYRQKYMKNPEL
jgi:hypothetical protein